MIKKIFNWLWNEWCDWTEEIPYTRHNYTRKYLEEDERLKRNTNDLKNKVAVLEEMLRRGRE